MQLFAFGFFFCRSAGYGVHGTHDESNCRRRDRRIGNPCGFEEKLKAEKIFNDIARILFVGRRRVKKKKKKKKIRFFLMTKENKQIIVKKAASARERPQSRVSRYCVWKNKRSAVLYKPERTNY